MQQSVTKIHDKVIHHVFSAIRPRQFGGLQGRSSLQQLLTFLHHNIIIKSEN